ncbi:MAG: DUF5615 family PIN-like protein [Chloroflexota bacterium]
MPQQIIVSDEHCSKHCQFIFYALEREGYDELLSLELKRIDEVGLYYGADDETVWRFCQKHGYILVTGNRTTKDGHQSLEMVVQDLVGPTSIPVLTIGDLDRVLNDREYCERCAEGLAEIVMDLDNLRGVTRLYLNYS